MNPFDLDCADMERHPDVTYRLGTTDDAEAWAIWYSHSLPGIDYWTVEHMDEDHPDSDLALHYGQYTYTTAQLDMIRLTFALTLSVYEDDR